MKEEFILDFVYPGSMTEIHVVVEVTGLSYEEIRRNSKILEI